MTQRPTADDVVDQLPAAVIAVDLDHLITWWNPGAEALYGWTAAEALGRSVRDLIFASAVPSDDIAAQTHSGRLWEGEVTVRLKDGSKRLVFVRNVPLIAADGTLIGVLGTSLDVTGLALGVRIDQVTERMARLQHLTAALVPASTVEEVIDAVLDAGILATGASAGAIMLLSDEGDLLELAGTRSSSASAAELPAQLLLTDKNPLNEALVTSRPVVFSNRAAMTTAYPDLPDVGDFQARVVVPITAGGAPLGVLSVSFDAPQEFDDADLQLLHTLVGQCGQALERCRLLAAETVVRTREALLGRASDLLNRSLSVAETLDTITGLLVPDRADWVVVHLREGDRDEDPVVTRAVAHRDAAAQAALAALSLGVPLDATGAGGAAEALRTGQSVLHVVVPESVRVRLRVPEGRGLSATLAEQLGAETGVAVPLLAGDQVLGTLTVARVAGPPYGESDVSLLEQLAARATVALTHARAYQRARESAVTLQRNLLPRALPDIPGLSFAWRYLPGAEGELVGGDWYDVFPLENGRVGLVIGDVMGHGTTAAAVMGQLRAMARAYAQAGLRPGAVLTRLDASLPDLEQEAIATLLFVELDPATATVVAASAGHLPPVVMSPGTEAELLAVEPGPPLGAGPGRYPESRRVLARDSTLLLYTDGLVEDRTRSVDQGLELLRSVAEQAQALGTDQLCDAVLAGLERDRDNDDDTALLAVAFSPDTRDSLSPFLSRVLASESEIPGLRRELRALGGRWHLPASATHDLLTVAGELTTNALLHVGPPVTTTVRLDIGSVRVEVHDTDGARLPLPSLASVTMSPDRVDDVDLDAVIDELAVSGTTGRGVHVVEQLTADWGVTAEVDGKTVWARVPFDSAGSADAVVEPVSAPGSFSVWLRGIPVRLILASSANLDDMIREFLVRADDRQLADLGATGQALVAASARTRDPFRVAARDAIARGQRLIDVATVVGPDTPAVLDGLQALIDQLLELARSGKLLAVAPDPEVIAFRTWWRSELLAQLSGQPASTCPFPALPQT